MSRQALVQIGTDDKRLGRRPLLVTVFGRNGVRAECDRLEIGSVFTQNTQLPSSPCSNIWIGAPGMIVEIACL